MKLYLLSLLIFPLIANTQTSSNKDDSPKESKGIKFEQGLSWKEIKAKAKAENKYIFVDVNASWCMPCKMMDKDVFPDTGVGNLANQYYVSIKVQVDTAKNDNEITKKWYADAAFINKNYQIKELPSFLFFSPDGNLVHKAIGFKGIQSSKELLSKAINEESQFYTLAAKFKKGQRDTKFVQQLLQSAREAGENDLAYSLFNDYINIIPEVDVFTKDNLDLIWSNTRKTNERGFRIYYENAEKINKILQAPGRAEEFVHGHIFKNEIIPFLKINTEQSNIEPSWNKIYAFIDKKYNSTYADRITIWAKIKYYEKTKNWNGFAENSVLYIHKYGVNLNEELLNSFAWVIFENTKNEKYLSAAAEWMKKKVISNNDPLHIDTYANLMYKLGKKAEAILWQTKAVRLPGATDETVNNLDRMKKGLPTWSTK